MLELETEVHTRVRNHGEGPTYKCLKCESASKHFQPGEGPSSTFSVIVKTSPEVRCVICSPHHHHHRALSGRLFNPNIFQSEIFGDYAFYQLFLEEDKRMITVIAAIMGKYIRLHYLMPGSLARRYCSGKK